MFEVEAGVRLGSHSTPVVIKWWPQGADRVRSPHGYARLHYLGWAMGSCASAEISGFMGAEPMADNPAELFSALYAAMNTGGAGYIPFNVFFLVSDNQIGVERDGYKYTPNRLVKLFIDNGAELKDSFENEAHGPNNVHLYRFNIKNVIGKYIDGTGKALTSKEKTNEQNQHPSVRTAAAPVQRQAQEA